MTITTLPTTGVGNSAAPNGWNSAPNGALTLIGDSNQDTNFGFVNTNSTGNYTQGYLFNGVPTDFVTMRSGLKIQLRYGWNAYDATLSTWPSLNVRIVSGTTILAASDTGTGFQNVAALITTTTPTNTTDVNFGFVNTTADKTAWDSAVVEILIERARNKGGNTNEQRVFALSVTGEYNALDTTTRYFFIT
jgi:hypothetical protein